MANLSVAELEQPEAFGEDLTAPSMNLARLTQGRLDVERCCDAVRLVRTTHAGDAFLDRHVHDRPAFTLVTAGSFIEEAGNETFACRSGTLLFKPAFTAHLDRYGREGARSVLIEIHPDAPGLRLPQAPRIVRTEKALRIARRLARGIGRDVRDDRGVHRRDLENEVVDLAALAFGEALAAGNPGRPAWLRRAYERLVDAPRAVPSVSELARQVGVHHDHLIRSFRAAYGETPGVFARRHRARVAAERVRHDDRSLASVAWSAGYADQSHMTREFRRFLGSTPGDVRRSGGTDVP